MQAQQFPFDPLKLFGTSRYGATTAEIDDEVSRWLETHHPIEIFDKRMPYPSNFYLSSDVPKKYGTLREVLKSLRSEFSYYDITQKYADLLATNQPVSVEPITFFINCLKEKRILQDGQDVGRDQMIEILSNCKQPGINPVMSDYIDYLQAKFIEFMMIYTSNARYERKIVLQYNFEHLVIPLLEELTNLNRNPKGHDFITSKLTRSIDGRMVKNVINWLVFDADDYNRARQPLMEAQRKAMELTKAERKANDSQSAFIRAEQLGYRGVATIGDTSKMLMNQDGFGGKRTKKRKQKRSTNKKRRIHKKRGRMSKRR